MDTITNQADLSYQYKIDPNAAPLNGSTESNTTSTNLILGNLTMNETVDKAYATIGDTLTYTVVVSNTGNILVSNVAFKDILPSGASFVAGSVTVNGVEQPTYDIATGFTLGSMLILAESTVTFKATIDSLPSPNTISNKASCTFNYLVLVPVSGSSESNTVITNVMVTDISAVKSCDVTDAEAGDELTYTIVVTNNGNVDATSMTLTDTIDAKTTFVNGSVTINGTAYTEYNPNTGFALPDIAPTDSATVIFKVTVN
ncbi:MAG: DUF11 domain-containing protein [Bacilli bacterium]|nr:DUF11 domain-containing protein [Bacilli bacterium]